MTSVETRIQVLPEFVASQIAAGEIVERPASVVKELVDNSLDARSTVISIDVVHGGKTLIRVTDNGEGMSRADAALACQRFATSKLHNQNDLMGNYHLWVSWGGFAEHCRDFTVSDAHLLA